MKQKVIGFQIQIIFRECLTPKFTTEEFRGQKISFSCTLNANPINGLFQD